MNITNNIGSYNYNNMFNVPTFNLSTTNDT